jgi:hypothetical protein
MAADTKEIVDQVRGGALVSKRKQADIARAFGFFRSRGIEALLIKGWASARYYPAEKPRFYGDLDIAVSQADFDAAERLLSTDGARLGVDLHCELRHLDTLPWHRLIGESATYVMEGVEVSVPRPEDHLRIVSTHWLNDGGAPRERLWDIYYAVANRPETFDWARCLEVVSKTRRTWLTAAIGLAHRYLGLNIEDLPFRREAENLPEWLTNAVEREWASGTRLIDLEFCLHDRKLLLTQLRKRLPPNPIQATIETEKPIDHSSRIPIQAADVIKRIPSSVRRIWGELRRVEPKG